MSSSAEKMDAIPILCANATNADASGGWSCEYVSTANSGSLYFGFLSASDGGNVRGSALGDMDGAGRMVRGRPFWTRIVVLVLVARSKR